MNAKALTERFDDVLEPLGIAVGAFLVLVGLGTVAGTPWTTNPNAVAVALNVIGSALVVALGVAMAYLSWNGRE